MITDIRLRSQQLVDPAFNDPKRACGVDGRFAGTGV